MTGDRRWSPDGELLKEHDLGLDDGDDLGSWNSTVIEFDPGIEKERDKIAGFSKIQ